MPQGTVKWFNQVKGFGFIEIEGGADLFVHISEVTGEITDGDTVQFEVGESDAEDMAAIEELFPAPK